MQQWWAAGEIGEHPIGVPNNLMPYIQQVALGQREQLSVFGHDYPTSDGTCVRDYIHVMDLAEGHASALEKLLQTQDLGCVAYNLGTGTGTSVLEMIKVGKGEKASSQRVPVSCRHATCGRCLKFHNEAPQCVSAQLGFFGTGY